jgi:hypothetical protein
VDIEMPRAGPILQHYLVRSARRQIDEPIVKAAADLRMIGNPQR